MNFKWDFLIDLGIISIALLIGTFLRSKVKFFQRFLIPNSLTAGFLLLPFYNWLAPLIGLDTMNLGNIVFHFISISFISMTLRSSDKRQRKGIKDIIATANSLLSQYAIQCFFGMGLTILIIKFIRPELFSGFGLFPTLGYSLGPGQAYSIGSGWEEYLNTAVAQGKNIIVDFRGLGDIGLTFGAIGFLWACFGGVFLVNYALKKGWVDKSKIENLNVPLVRMGVRSRVDKEGTTSSRNMTNPEAIDPLTFNAALVLVVYLITFLLLKGATYLLAMLGDDGVALSQLLWGIMFVFGALVAMLVKIVLKLFRVEYIVDNDRLNRVSGFSVDFMVAAGIGAISVAVIQQYWLPILIVATIIGVITTFTHIWLSSRIFTDHVFYRAILVYGCATGTLPTGLALLRIIDPNFETPASRDYMYASGFVLTAAIPILITANKVLDDAVNGGLKNSFILLGLYAAYILVCFIIYLLISGKRRFRDPQQIWLERK